MGICLENQVRLSKSRIVNSRRLDQIGKGTSYDKRNQIGTLLLVEAVTSRSISGRNSFDEETPNIIGKLFGTSTKSYPGFQPLD
jgi:hypothetical protein